jgi:SAM-dependent methyltransferase
MDPFLHGNQQLWDEWADINYESQLYDVAGFIANPSRLDPLVLENVGDVAGKSVLHMQCHFGKDTLRLALMGATVTGVDFSAKAIAYARALASEMHIPATFVEANLYDLPQALQGQFDMIFTSYGVLGWLPDLTRWGAIIAHFLKPGGVFVIVEAHPVVMIFDDAEAVELRVKYPYFYQAEPLIFAPHVGCYADPTATVTHTEYNWPHDMAEILNALLMAGLRLDYLREYPQMAWQALPFMVQDAEGWWRLPPEYPQLPLSFALHATKG